MTNATMAENVLTRIDGAELGRLVLTLPDVTATTAETVEAVIDAANVGRVKVTFRKFRKRYHRTSLLSWLAESAERV